MQTDESITRWISELKDGDEQAAVNIWGHFYARLLLLARRRLQGNASPVADEEDVVAQALASFFRGARQSRFPLLADRNDLWRLLAKITVRKAHNQRRDLGRLKRSAVQTPDEASEVKLDEIASLHPTPENAALAAETFRRLLAVLDQDLRQIALWRLEGFTIVEIAGLVKRSTPTVERRLRLIRDKWCNADLP